MRATELRKAALEIFAAAVQAAWAGAGGTPLVVCTGGEPLLQLDAPLIDALLQPHPQLDGLYDSIEEAIRDADIINLLRIQHERQRKSMFPSLGEYTSFFGLNKARLALTKPDALIMHPGPINRGVEIDSEIADCARSLVLQQVIRKTT
jgi:aspartate carbamoyltransferase catalytic subunit